MIKRLLIGLLLIGSAFGQAVRSARMINGVNLQTGTSYTFQPIDATQLVTFSNAGAVAASLPNGTGTGFGSGRIFSTQNLGPGTVTITCSGCLIFSSGSTGSTTLILTPGEGADIWSGGGNYTAFTGGGGGGSGGLCAVVGTTLTCPGAATFGGGGTFAGPITANAGQSSFEFSQDPICLLGSGTSFDQLCDLLGDLVWDANGTLNQKVLVVKYTPGTTGLIQGSIYAFNSTNADFEIVANALLNPITGALTVISLQTTKGAFSSLVACSSALEGTHAAVTDSTTATWGATISGSGTHHVSAYCDGTNWTVEAS